MGLKEKTEGRYNFCDAFCVEFYWIFLPEHDNLRSNDGTSVGDEESESSLFLSENDSQTTWITDDDPDFVMDSESTDFSE